jgi:hypothetical protein
MSNKSKQKSTKVDSDIELHGEHYYKLSEKHRYAVDLRLIGVGLRDIAHDQRILVSHGTARGWFMKGGVCYDAYKQESHFLAQDRKRRFKLLDKKLQQLANDAILQLEHAIKTSDTKLEVKAALALDILKMVGLEAPKKLKHSNDPDHPITAPIIVALPDNNRDEKAKQQRNNSQGE